MTKEMVALVEHIAKSLVDKKDQVQVQERQNEQGMLVIGLKVAHEDLGKVIGKQGRTIHAMRIILRAIAAKNSSGVFLEIQE